MMTKSLKVHLNESELNVYKSIIDIIYTRTVYHDIFINDNDKILFCPSFSSNLQPYKFKNFRKYTFYVCKIGLKFTF